MNYIQIMAWVCITGLAYHYLGYPLIVFLMSRIAPYHVRREAIHPRVSLIVAAYNESAVIKLKIEKYPGAGLSAGSA